MIRIFISESRLQIINAFAGSVALQFSFPPDILVNLILVFALPPSPRFLHAISLGASPGRCNFSQLCFQFFSAAPRVPRHSTYVHDSQITHILRSFYYAMSAVQSIQVIFCMMFASIAHSAFLFIICSFHAPALLVFMVFYSHTFDLCHSLQVCPLG